MTVFDTARQYTRAEVQDILQVPASRRRGIWETGYASYEGEVFIFCNVGLAGRTGHDYANRWMEDGRLDWFGKTTATARQPVIAGMVSGSTPVHLFWRDNSRPQFNYAGLAQADEVHDEIPVRIVWRFSAGVAAITDEALKQVYEEGRRRLKIHLEAERSGALQRDFRASLGDWRCVACGFDFEKVYGPLGRKFIEGHHKDPLAAGMRDSTIDDLEPVCSNCHRMMHKARPVLTATELRKLIVEVAG